MSNIALLSGSLLNNSGNMLGTIYFFGCVLTTLLLFSLFCSSSLPYSLLTSLSPLKAIGFEFRDHCWCAQVVEGEVARSNPDCSTVLAAILGWADRSTGDGGV